jgi:hypothetical protein
VLRINLVSYRRQIVRLPEIEAFLRGDIDDLRDRRVSTRSPAPDLPLQPPIGMDPIKESHGVLLPFRQ